MENCLKGYICAAQVQEPCSFGMAHVIQMKIESKRPIKGELKNIQQEQRCPWGVSSHSQKDFHCMWKMMENRDEKPMSVKEIAKALCIPVQEVEEILEKALLKLRNTDEASDWFDMKMQGIDIYEGLSHHIDDIDFYNDGCLSGISSGGNTGGDEVAPPSEDGKKRGRPPRRSQASVPLAHN